MIHKMNREGWRIVLFRKNNFFTGLGCVGLQNVGAMKLGICRSQWQVSKRHATSFQRKAWQDIWQHTYTVFHLYKENDKRKSTMRGQEEIKQMFQTPHNGVTPPYVLQRPKFQNTANSQFPSRDLEKVWKNATFCWKRVSPQLRPVVTGFGGYWGWMKAHTVYDANACWDCTVQTNAFSAPCLVCWTAFS